MSRKLRSYWYVFLSFILSGCMMESPSPVVPISSMSGVNITPPSSSTQLITQVADIKTPTDPHHTPTSPDIQITETQTSSIKKTPIPIVKDYSELIEYISITGSTSCKLPCLIGITPGKTTWDEAIYHVNPLHEMATIKKYLNIENSPILADNALSIEVYEETHTMIIDLSARSSNDQMIINWIRVIASSYTAPDIDNPSIPQKLPEQYSMKNVIQQYGIPEMVFLDTDFGVPEYPTVALSILMVYPKYKFLIEYHRIAEVIGEDVISCEPSSGSKVIIVDNESSLSTIESIRNSPGLGKLNIEYRDNFNDIEDSSLDDFFMDYLTSPSDCLYLPAESWFYMLD